MSLFHRHICKVSNNEKQATTRVTNKQANKITSVHKTKPAHSAENQCDDEDNEAKSNEALFYVQN